MKRDRLFSWFWAAALAFLLSCGVTGCLASAFEFPLAEPFWTAMAVICPLAAALCAFPFGLPAGLALLVFGGGYLWLRSSLSLQLDALVYTITKCYRSGYGWPVLTWTQAQDPELTVVLPFILIAAFLALVTARVVVGRGKSFPAIAAAAPVITLCVILNDTVPAMPYLMMSLFALVMLLMTQTLRRSDVRGSNRLCAMLTLPLAVALAALFYAVPQEGYTPAPEDLAQKTVAWFQEQELGQELAEKVMDFFTGGKSDRVDLKNSGPRGNQKYKVMEVTAESSGLLYLHGRAYDVYDGRQWQSTDGEWALDDDYIRSAYQGTVDIRTNGVHDVLYYPMATESAVTDELYRGYLSNGDRLKEYSFPWYIQPSVHHTIRLSYQVTDDGSGDTDIRSGAEELMRELAGQYLALPEDTRMAAEGYLRENTEKVRKRSDIKNEMSIYRIAGKSYALPACAAGDVILEAAIVCELVKHSAVYDLKTRKMPSGESDFAMWFLNESDTGYCVHFATAATVLLRAAGIPARYVEGYLVTAKAGQTVTVRGEDAHAWAEYWVPGYGWMMLEATPGYGSGSQAAETTEPEDTAAATLPGQTEASTPAQTTQPHTPTGPDVTRPNLSGGDATEATENVRPPLPGGNGNGPVPDLRWLMPVVKWLALVAIALAALWGQWKLRLTLRLRRLRQGSTNRQALYYWRELLLIWKLLNAPPSQELEGLALKARFSQYTLEAEELDAFTRARADGIARLRQRNLLLQLFYRLAMALY